MGADWVLCDDGLSHNGTFVNGERVRGRRRLRDGDVVAVGATQIDVQRVRRPRRHGRRAIAQAQTPRRADARAATAADGALPAAARVGLRGAASNRQIAEELVISVDTVKGTLSALFELLRRCPRLPQNQKRADARRPRAPAASAVADLA